MLIMKTNCDSTCDCQPRIIATAVTNRNNPTWDLTPYQGNGIGTPFAKWRLFERSYENDSYESGDIDKNGKLVGLPSKFESSYYYDGYMELQQGCPNMCCTEEYCYDTPLWP